MVGKKDLIDNINNIAPYIVLHKDRNVLRRGPSSSSIVKKIGLIVEKAKDHACKYLKTMEECINLVFHAWVVIKCVAIEVAELKGIPLQGGALKRCGNVGLDKGSASKDDEALKTLYKEHNIPIIHVSIYQNYFIFSVYPIKVRIKIT